MKTSTISTLNVLFTLMLFLPYAYAETPQTLVGTTLQKVTTVDRTGTIIDVQGSRFGDRMWIITVPECTRGFDNGWDGYKMFGSTLAPQIFSMEVSGNFQVNSIPDINNTYIGFLAGEDTVYTLTFTHYFLETYYKELYLVDLIENKTINIYATGTQYAFVAQQTAEPVKRFEIITSLPVPPVVVDTVVVKPKDSNDKNEEKDSKDLKDKKEQKDEKDHVKKIKVFNSHKTIVVDNSTEDKGDLTLYNAQTGSVIKKTCFNSKGITTIPIDVPDGVYIVKGITNREVVTERIIVR